MNWQQMLSLVCFGAAGGILVSSLIYVPLLNKYIEIIHDLLDERDELEKE